LNIFFFNFSNFLVSIIQTALMHASRSGLRQAPEVAAMLLALPVPARVDLKSRLFQTSLMLSCEAGLLEVSRSLLTAERPADINARDNFGRTALHFAAARGRLDCVRLLLTADPPADLEFEAMMPSMVNGSDVAPRKAEQVAATDEIRVLLTEARRAELLLSLERVAKLNAENKALRKRISELEARK
jgi:ankyrin repeat protein